MAGGGTVLELENDLLVGALSYGEVQLNALKLSIEKAGVPVEYQLSSTGASLVCGGGKVVLRKEQENDFVLEGDPSALYYKIRAILYQRYAFI